MLYLDEVFLSIQGESKETGLPCVFVRLYGCPIGCSYCDCPQDRYKGKRISIENLIKKIRKYRGIKRVCITGGEPLIYDETLSVVYELLNFGYDVSIETSGCIPIEESPYHRSYRYVMDIKCPSSGVEEKNIYKNLRKLQFEDEVKFVIANREDYEFMKSILNRYRTSASILVSPLFNSAGEAVIKKELVDWILKDKLDVRVQIQLHKILNVK